MKHLLPILLLLCAFALSSCVSHPVVVDRADGSTIAYLGGSLGAKVGPRVADITTRNGTRIKYASRSEDGTDVPLGYIAGDVTKTLSGHTAGVANHAATTNSKTTLGLGAQSVEKAEIKSAEKVTLGTFQPE